jgi:hypothetical protein
MWSAAHASARRASTTGRQCRRRSRNEWRALLEHERVNILENTLYLVDPAFDHCSIHLTLNNQRSLVRDIVRHGIFLSAVLLAARSRCAIEIARGTERREGTERGVREDRRHAISVHGTGPRKTVRTRVFWSATSLVWSSALCFASSRVDSVISCLSFLQAGSGTPRAARHTQALAKHGAVSAGLEPFDKPEDALGVRVHLEELEELEEALLERAGP